MKTHLLPVLRFLNLAIVVVTIINLSFAQHISICPVVDSINLVGSCTPAQFTCQLKESSLGIDTIVIRTRYSDPLCTAFPPNLANTISSFKFIIRDSLNSNRYELWIRPTTYGNHQLLGYDTVYWFPPQLNWLALKVFSGETLIDSSRIKFRTIQTGLSVKNNSTIRPVRVSLEQNYPNPFNPVTVIHFSTPSRGHVSLKLFDIRGKEIITLISDWLDYGEHSCEWNASGLASGIYFCRLESDLVVQTTKLCLLK